MVRLRLTCLAFALLAGVIGFHPAPSRADHYSGPPDSWTAYWAVPAFADIKDLGPEKAKGVILWSHGVSGNEAAYYAHPPDIVRRLARAGWDVIKVQRNPLFERNWATSGRRHVADLSGRVDAALAQGYKNVIAAGGSYGGAISIETARVNTKIFAVLAFAPGHGSDAEGGGARLYDNLTGYLVEAIADMKTERALVLVAGNDHLHPREDRGPPVRRALDPLGIPYVLLDERIPIKGHSAVVLNQFDAWYGACTADFVDPSKTLLAGEFSCPTPSPVPRFLYPPDLQIVPPKSNFPAEIAALSGTWSGSFGNEGREVSVVVESIGRFAIDFVYATSAGPQQNLNMRFARRTAIGKNGRYVSELPQQPTVSLVRIPTSDELSFVIISADGRFTFEATLKRAVAP